VDYGQSDVTQLGQLIDGQRAFVRVCLGRAAEGWALRRAEAVAGADLPRWSPAQWHYQDFVFAADWVSAQTLTSWFQTGDPGSLTLGGWRATVPTVQQLVSFQREPSRARHDSAPLPWPACNYDVHAAAGGVQQVGGQGFLVGDDCPSFPSFETAYRAFFTGKFSMTGTGNVPSDLARIRVLQQDAWLRRIKVGATHIDVQVAGTARDGTRVELNSSTLQVGKRVGKTGRTRIPLLAGLPDDAWLYLSRDRQWLDYRALGLDVAGWADPAQRGIEIERTDDPATEIGALLSVGEGPRTEYKRQLPDRSTDSKRKVLKTVAAFANEDGGNIIFGMDPDEMTLVGVDQDPKDIRDRLGQLIRGNVVPPDPEYDVQSIRIKGKLIVVLEVRASAGGPYGLQFQDKPVEFYVRRGGSTYAATQSEVRALAQPPAQHSSFPVIPFTGGYKWIRDRPRTMEAHRSPSSRESEPVGLENRIRQVTDLEPRHQLRNKQNPMRRRACGADWLRGSLLAPPAGERWLHPHEGDSCSVSFGPTARGLCQSAGQLAARATALTSTTAGT
jgi:hypothetical protein